MNPECVVSAYGSVRFGRISCEEVPFIHMYRRDVTGPRDEPELPPLSSLGGAAASPTGTQGGELGGRSQCVPERLTARARTQPVAYAGRWSSPGH